MAAPVYSTDLVLITAAETTADGGAWVAIGGGNITLGSGPDFSMQGTNCVDAKVTNTDKGPGVPVSTVTLGANDHIYTWVFLATPGLVATLANNGLAVAIGTSASALVKFAVAGSDTYGAAGRAGQCFPVRYVNTAKATGPNYRTLVGSPGAAVTFVGATANVLGLVKGSNLGVDAIRKGTGVFITQGDSINPATLANTAATNDQVNNRWGVLTKVGASFELQGRLVIGQNTAGTPTAAYFTASNQTIVVVDTPHCLADFTQLVFDHAGSTVLLTNLTVKSDGTTNPGRLVFNNAGTTATLSACVFDRIGVSTLRAGVTATSCTWLNAGDVTQNGATIAGGAFRGTTLRSANPGNISGVDFFGTGTGAGHGIELTAPGTYTLSDLNFSAYGAGGSLSAAVYNNSGGLVTLNVSGGNTPTVRNGTGASTVLTSGAVTVTVAAAVSLVGAEVRIYDLDGIPAGSLGTELAGEESNASATFVYSGSAGNTVWVQILKTGYKEFGQEYLVPASNATLVALLRPETNA